MRGRQSSDLLIPWEHIDRLDWQYSSARFNVDREATNMSESAARFARAADFFEGHVQVVPDSSWSNQTPCADWNVRALVNHVAGEQLWAAPLLRGKTIVEVGDQFDGDVLGDDPAGSWVLAAAESRRAFAAPGALDGVVHLSYGDESATNYCDQMTLDCLVHGWDLARGIKVDEVIPDELVDWAIAAVEPMQEMLTASGMFGTPLAISDKADNQTRLLAMLGRRG